MWVPSLSVSLSLSVDNLTLPAVPVVQETWAKDAEGSIAYYSEVEDDQFNTTDIGVPNTERG